jgi:hypothetical protein
MKRTILAFHKHVRKSIDSFFWLGILDQAVVFEES